MKAVAVVITAPGREDPLGAVIFHLGSPLAVQWCLQHTPDEATQVSGFTFHLGLRLGAPSALGLAATPTGRVVAVTEQAAAAAGLEAPASFEIDPVAARTMSANEVIDRCRRAVKAREGVRGGSIGL
jgi:hypothetical protein